MAQTAIVQPVSDVPRPREPLRETPVTKAIEGLAHCSVESCSDFHGTVLASVFHPVVAAVHCAFSDHRPLILSPDMFWLMIAQGFARHVNLHPEELRHHFVAHEGKKKLTVRDDTFVKGSPDNPWPEVFGEFSDQIREHIGNVNHANIVASFSTTGVTEKAANEVVLMTAMKNYFEYEFETICGIPEVTLEGTADDWLELHRRTEVLGATYSLEWWTNCITPTLKRIARNAAGADDPELWRNIYKVEGESGGPYIDGWIVDFFPYLQRKGYFDEKRGEFLDDPSGPEVDWKYISQRPVERRNWLFNSEQRFGITLPSLPGPLCRAPFTWNHLVSEFQMLFIAGFIGCSQRPRDLAIRPVIGWAVCEA